LELAAISCVAQPEARRFSGLNDGMGLAAVR